MTSSNKACGNDTGSRTQLAYVVLSCSKGPLCNGAQHTLPHNQQSLSHVTVTQQRCQAPPPNPSHVIITQQCCQAPPPLNPSYLISCALQEGPIANKIKAVFFDDKGLAGKVKDLPFDKVFALANTKRVSIYSRLYCAPLCALFHSFGFIL